MSETGIRIFENSPDDSNVQESFAAQGGLWTIHITRVT
jgi:hypothetical protein